MKNKLWIFSSYIPSIDTTRRTTNFTGANPGPRTLTQTTTTHNAYNRLDYGVTNTLRLFGSWNYGYFRHHRHPRRPGQPVTGQTEHRRTTDPNTLRSDAGSVNPLAVYSFGGDWTPTAKLVVSARYGYFFNNTEQRGTPPGTRYLYEQRQCHHHRPDGRGDARLAVQHERVCQHPEQPRDRVSTPTSARASTRTFPTSSAIWPAPTRSRAGTSSRRSPTKCSVPTTAARSTCFWESELHARHQHHGLRRDQGAEPLNFGKATCQGRYGYFTVGTDVVNTGGSSQTAQALYFQDAWQVDTA